MLNEEIDQQVHRNTIFEGPVFDVLLSNWCKQSGAGAGESERRMFYSRIGKHGKQSTFRMF